ncbi:hypothetical protein [Terracidiphilus gabretensis]|uniref:hypothetical protein n=1 Tax=Terracidiphilus gabretensis TaxID=1577687 RepID=UPI00071B8F21|nr:hypothetical protein [Terracidiphilus gabretensis]
MQTYNAYSSLVASSDIAAGILLNTDTRDVQFVPLKPFPLPAQTIRALDIQWEPRRLNLVGVMGWNEDGIQAHLEPLPERIVTALKIGFDAYLATFSMDMGRSKAN